MDEGYGFLDSQMRMLRENEEHFRSLSLNLNRMEKDFSQQLAHWRESLFSFQVMQWVETIQSNYTVETVTVDLSVGEDTIWKKDQLKSLMAVIGSLPRLRKLVLRQNNLGGPRRLKPIEAIISAVKMATNSIECFELWGNEILPSATEQPMEELLWAIDRCESLKSLKFLGFRLNPDHVAQLTPLMAMPSLTEFCLGNTSDGFLPIVKQLQSCSHIEKLTLSFLDDIDDTNCMALVHALQFNTSLQMLALLNASPRNNTSGISPNCELAFIDVLEHSNVTLQEFKVRGQPNDEMQLYVKLNRAGRQDLFHQKNYVATRDRWVHTLITSRDDLDCSFYFLTMNPSVCVA